MIKATVIRAQTMAEAMRIYGEESVQMVFELIRDKAPSEVFEELKDENLKKCLFFLLSGDIN